jgi:hypothetical protein
VLTGEHSISTNIECLMPNGGLVDNNVQRIQTTQNSHNKKFSQEFKVKNICSVLKFINVSGTDLQAPSIRHSNNIV